MTAPKSRHVKIGSLTVGNDLPMVLIAGPCQMESRAHAFETATALKELCEKAGVGLIYKSSFDKANRTSVGGKRGLGLEASLPVFAEIRGEWPIVCIDDLASELDQPHQRKLLLALANVGAQTLISGTQAPQAVHDVGAAPRMFHVELGEVRALI